MLSRKKTNSNCCTAALAVYLRALVMSLSCYGTLKIVGLSLFIIITYCCLMLSTIGIALVLRLGHTTGGVHVLIWTC